MRGIFNDEARIQRWLDVEAALALEQAKLGMIPTAAAEEIAAKSKFDAIDMDLVLHHLAV
ncbi:MAG TPA: adenylosuccinate lyase, partial [Roseovarius nubinhibens]|nr:adenylosuccinate lyase [Roseovarius nubinhibens]